MALVDILLLLKFDDFSKTFFVHFENLQAFELVEKVSLFSWSLSIYDILLSVPPVLFREEQFILHSHCLLAANIVLVFSLGTVCFRELVPGFIDVLAINREERLRRIFLL